MKLFSSPFGELQLGRHPYDETPNLQAWNAADELLLQYAKEHFQHQGRFLVLNDNFGALSLGLIKGGAQVSMISDSSLAQRALLTNMGYCDLPEQNLTLLDSLQIPVGKWDGILMKLPKSLGILEWQLTQLNQVEGPFIAGGMTKDIHTSTVKTFEIYRKDVTTSLAEKKARLILTGGPVKDNVSLVQLPIPYKLQALDCQVVAHGGVFSSRTLDQGTEFLLKNFPRRIEPSRIIDLGCGTGLLGLAAAKNFPQAQVFLVDESFMALWSARETFKINGLGSRGVFLTGDGLEDFSTGYADLILCNPPFHFQNVQTQEVARKMIRESRRVLKPGGQLWLVANSHLGYHVEMKSLFKDLKVAAKNEKFVILRAIA